MTAAQVTELKSRMLSMYAAIKAAPSAHNMQILNRAAAELFNANGEVFSNGSFVKVN